MLRRLWRLLSRRRQGVKQVQMGRTEEPISSRIQVNRRKIKEAYGDSSDLVVRELQTGTEGKISVLVVHVDGLVNKREVSEAVIEPIIDLRHSWESPSQAYQDLKKRFLAVSDIKEVFSLEIFLTYVASGDCGVLIDGIPRGLICSTRGWESRALEEPVTEATIRGPKVGFVETLRTNTTLLRRRLKDPRLRIEEQKIGTLSKTDVAIAYISGVANQEMVQEVRNRLERIDVDSIQESGHLEEYIEDAPLSPFPTILRTERPDRVAGSLLEGRAAILVDGTPFVLIVPATFTMFLSTPEDYFERFFIGSAIRLLRTVAFFMSLTLPSLYVAVTTFHQELLPTSLILSIAAQREGVPFPAMVEALLMELTFEIMREAGTRLPRIIGPAISIIGALVLGDAAIRAGLVSPAMVVVVAFTGIASFATPVFSLAIGTRLLRFLMIGLAASLGLFGIIMGLFALLIHLTALRSFGVPFLEPLAPVVFSDLKDALIRAPWWALRTRPKLIGKKAPIRQAPGLKPRPPSVEEKQVRHPQGREGGK